MRKIALLLLAVNPLVAQRLWVGHPSTPRFPADFYAQGEGLILRHAGVNSDLMLEIRGLGEYRQMVAARPVAEDTLFAVLPEDVPLGKATLSLIDCEQTETTEIEVQRIAFGLFSKNGNGTGLVNAQIARQAVSANGYSNAAHAGDVVVLWASGLGVSSRDEIRVEIDGISAKPDYAGPAPGNPGIDQINFVLPANVHTGCFVPVRLRAGDLISEPVTIAVAGREGPCAHPLGFSVDELRKLDNNYLAFAAGFNFQERTPYGNRRARVQAWGLACCR